MSEQSKIDAERAAFEADLIERWKNQHPIAFSVPEDAQLHLAGMMLARRDDGEYDNLVPREAWAAWQARASLPVGVPDGIAEQHAKAMRLLCEAHSWIIPKGNISVSIFERIGAFLDSAAAPAAHRQAQPHENTATATDAEALLAKYGPCRNHPGCGCKVHHGFDCIPL